MEFPHRFPARLRTSCTPYRLLHANSPPTAARPEQPLTLILSAGIHQLGAAPTPRSRASMRQHQTTLASALRSQLARITPPPHPPQCAQELARTSISSILRSFGSTLARNPTAHAAILYYHGYGAFNRLLSLFLISSHDDADGIHDHQLGTWEGNSLYYYQSIWDRRYRKIPSSPIKGACLQRWIRETGMGKGRSRKPRLGISRRGMIIPWERSREIAARMPMAFANF
jgi:hypothetical protein